MRHQRSDPSYRAEIGERLESLARSFPYPPTPDLAAEHQRLTAQTHPPPRLRRRLAWSASIAFLLLAGVLVVPSARAQVLEFLQLGVVRIFLSDSSPSPTSKPVPSMLQQPSATLPLAVAQKVNLDDLAGETSLQEARERAGYPILLPSYPPDLGHPGRVYFQDSPAAMTILVWMNPEDPELIRLALFVLPPGPYVAKTQPQIIKETMVNQQPALWTSGDHIVFLRSRNQIDERRFVTGNVLIWQLGEITYRLETDLRLEEAVRIAESLR